MKIKHGIAAAAALAFLLITGVQTFAASPGRASYQGTLRKNGILFSGTAAMEFRVTNADGSAIYWTSGSTDVVVSTGLFRYPLGTPNEASFDAISWKEITPYVQMSLDGGWLPREPLYTSVYSLHAKTSESSTGTFTINGGDLRLVAASGGKGIYFPDGTSQFSAPGWAVTGSYTSFAGGAGVGTLTPATRLDVKGAVADPYVQFWRDESGVVKATMTAAGVLYADGSQLINLPAGADNLGNHTATTALLMGNNPINNAGAITANGQITTLSSATVTSVLGVAAAKLKLAAGVELSSYSAGGVFISSNVTLAAGGKYFGNGSMLTGVNDSLGSHIATQTLNMAGYHLRFDSNVEISSSASPYSGIYFSTNVNLAPGAKYYGDGTGLTGITGTDNLGNHTMTQNLVTGANWISYDGTPNIGLNLDAQGHAALNQAAGSAGLDLRGSANNYIQIWRANSGLEQASMTASGILYADGSKLRNVWAGGTANRALNMAGYDIVSVSTLTLSSVTSSGIGVVFSTNVLLMNGRLGINTALPQDSLDVNGNIMSSSLAGAGVRCVSADATGKLYTIAGPCGNSTGSDNMGDHTMAINLVTNGHWISFDGSNGGLSVNASSNVGVGIYPAATRLDVQARSGDPYVQIWRNSAGVEQASMSATGLIFADASKMRNLPTGGDSFGNHTATQPVNMAGNQLLNVSLANFSANVEISSSTGLNRGIYVSTNIYIVGVASATKYYGDGSSLTGVISSPDNLGNHTATLNLNMAGKDIVSVSTISLSSVTSTGIGVVFSTNVLLMNGRLGVNTLQPQESLDVNGNIMSSSLSGAGVRCVSADATGKLYTIAGPCGNSTGSDNMGDHTMAINLVTNGHWISFDGSNGGLSVNASSNVGVGIYPAATRLDVQARSGDPYVQIWRNSAGVEQASMSATGFIYADASQMRNLPSGGDSFGSHTATKTVNMAGYDIVGVSTVTLSSVTSSGIGVVFSTNVLVMKGWLGVNTAYPQQALDVNGDIKSSGLSGFGDGCVTADNAGKLYTTGIPCGSGAGTDNMGNEVMTTNMQTGSYWISYSGLQTGIRLDAASDVSIGAAVADVPGARLDVRGTGLAPIQAWRDNAGVVRASMDSGGGLAASSATVNGQVTVYSSATVTSAFGVGAARLRLKANVEISSETAALLGGGVRISSNVYIVGFSSATKYYGDGSGLTGVNGSDNLGNHTASQDLNLNTFNLINVASMTARGAITSYSSVTIAGELGLGAALRFDGNVNISSATGLYGGIYISTNVNLVSGAKYYVNGVEVSGGGGGNIEDTLTATLVAGNNAGGNNIVNAGAIDAASLGAAKLSLSANVEISSETSASLGAGIRVSSNVYIVGLSSAAKYYGDGSPLTGLSASNISAGTLSDTHLSANVPLLNAAQTFTAANIFSSNVRFTVPPSSLPGVYISSGLIVENGDVGIGTLNPQAKLDVNGGIRIGDTSNPVPGTIRYSGSGFEGYNGGWQTLNGSYSVENSTALWGVGTNTVYTVGSSSNVAIGTLDAGVNKLRVTGSGNTSAANAFLAENLSSSPLLTVRNDGNVSVGPQAPATRLDVQAAAGDIYAQFWRNSGGTLVSSMSAAGTLMAARFVGDGSSLTGLTGTQVGLNNVTNVAQLPLSYLDTDTALTMDSDFKVPSQKAIKYYVDAGLNDATIVKEADLTINDFNTVGNVVYLDYANGQAATTGQKGFLTAADWNTFNAKFGPNSDINLNTFNLVNVASITAGGAITSYSSVTVRGALDVGANGYSQIWRDSGNVIMASMTAGGILYADGSQLRNVVGGGGGGGSLSTILASNPNAENGSIINISSMAIGRVTADAALDVHALALQNHVQLWRGLDDVPFAKMTLENGPGQLIVDEVLAAAVKISSTLAVGNIATFDNKVVLNVLAAFSGAASGNNNTGLSSVVAVDPSGDIAGVVTLIGGTFRAALGGPGFPHAVSFPTLIGLRAGTFSNTDALKTVTNGYGIYVQNEHDGGTLTNSYGVNIARPIISATVTSLYGLYIEDHSGIGGTNYNIYSADSIGGSRNYFGGLVEAARGVQVNTSTTRPPCNSGTRGLFWLTRNADTALADVVEVCAKDALSAYSWHALY